MGESELKRLLKEVFGGEESAFHILYSTERIEMGKGIPTEPKGKGCAFADRIEVRWSKEEGKFSVLALSDEEDERYLKFGLSKVEEDWEVKKEETFLQDLSAPSVSPSFESYPGGGRKGRLTIHVFKRGGEPVLQSPRRMSVEEIC